jgi:23S rRNA (adenine2030-N6)-methyltransferase
VRGLEAAHRKWAGGIYLMWYPIKTRREPDTLARRLARSGIAKILRAELSVAHTPDDAQPRDTRVPRDGPLGGCGLIVVNPPWPLAGELAILLPELAAILSGAGAGSHRLDWLAGEN